MYATPRRKRGLGDQKHSIVPSEQQSLLQESRESEMAQSAQSERRAIEHEVRESDLGSSRGDAISTHPQATKDPLDPLNWTWWRKHTILSIVMFMYFMFTYITTTTIPSFPELQSMYNITYSQVTLTVAIPSLGLSFGPLLWSPLSETYGRRIVFITGTTMAFIATLASAVAKNYPTYMAARFFQGLGACPGGSVGMAIINDLFFEHQRGQKIGLWVLSINTGLFVGPVVGGFLDQASPNWVNWLTSILFGLLLLLELFFLPETLYPRNLMLKLTASATTSASTKVDSVLGTVDDIHFKRTSDLAFLNLKPVPAIQPTKLWESASRFCLTFRLTAVFVTVGIFCFAWYWWILSIVTLIPAAYGNFSPSKQGLLFLGLLAGSWFAELCCSGKLSDWLIRRLRGSTRGPLVPEMRLWLAYPGAILTAAGLILWGISIDHHLHWWVGQMAFFLFAMGLQMGNTVISTYIIDCYPLQSMSIITFYSVILDLSAFINPFFINAWVDNYGYTTTFAVQGTIVVAFAVPVIALVHHFGAPLRQKSWTPTWTNPEYDDLDIPAH